MKGVLFLSLFVSCLANAEQLVTSSYEIKVGSCPEGNVTCDKIPIVLRNLITGNTSNHIGETLHTLCADGVTPCRFLGYKFSNETGTFYLYEHGSLVINDKSSQPVLVEDGIWSE